MLLKNSITGLRDVRNKQQVKPKETIVLHIQTEDEVLYRSIENILSKHVNSKTILFTNSPVPNCISTVIGKDKFYLETERAPDNSHQRIDLEKELDHLQNFLISIEKKLGNEKFMAHAKPEVLALEQKKKADAEIKLRIIRESLASMQN